MKLVQYDRLHKRDGPDCRAAKKKAQSEAQSRFNQKSSAEKLEFLLAANFRRGDLVVVLTYADDKNVNFREDTMPLLKAFRKKMSQRRKTKCQPFVCVWNIESRHEKGRYHHHMVINSTGDDIDDLRAAWPYGNVHIEALRVDKEKNYATQARYMCKEYPDYVGQRTWSHTMNCKKPEMESYAVSDDTVIDIPEGAIVLEDVTWSNQYTSFRYVKYIASSTLRAPRAKRKHKRRLRN